MKNIITILLSATIFFSFSQRNTLAQQWLENGEGIYYLGNVGINGGSSPTANLKVYGSTSSYEYNWGLASQLHGDQGGAIELGAGNSLGETPYIDLHYGITYQDFNTRIMNSADNRLDIMSQNGTKMTFDGKTLRFGYVLPSVKLTNNIVNGFTSGSSLVSQNPNGVLGIDFWNFGATNGVMNFYAKYDNELYNQFSVKSDNTCGWGNDVSWLSAGKPNTAE